MQCFKIKTKIGHDINWNFMYDDFLKYEDNKLSMIEMSDDRD